MSASLIRRLLAEGLGTAIIVLFGTGAVVAAHLVDGGRPSYSGVGVIALAFAFGVALSFYVWGTTSGGHFNPAVTIALAIVGRFRWVDVIPYLVAQVLGACVGSLLVVVYAGERAGQLGGVGLTALGGGVSPWQGVVAESLGTLLLLLVIMAVAVDSRAPTGLAGLLIGLGVAAQIMVIGAFTGGSVNPARTFGPYLVNEFITGTSPWSQLWLYVVGPVVGGACAALLYEGVARPLRDVSPVSGRDEDAVTV